MKFDKTHGLYGTRLYTIHKNMKSRCYNSNLKYYGSYGGRGIKICDKWLEYDYENKINTGFLNFYNWAINNGYEEDLTIDRIDPNGNYEPSNCRWVSMKLQSNNRNDNKYIEYKGYNFTVTIWSEITKISDSTISKRLSRGWSIEDALRTPPGNKRGEGFLCWEVPPEYIKYHNPDLNRVQTNANRESLSEETKKKLSKANKGTPNYACRKLNDTQIYLIRILKKYHHYTDRSLAEMFNVSHSRINDIVNMKTCVVTKHNLPNYAK